MSEPTSFEEIYEAYAERVLNLAYRITGDEESARDLSQEVFVKVYENLDGFERRSQIYTWVYRIAVNHVSNYLKRQRRMRWINVMDDLSEVVGPEVPAPSHADRQLEARERARAVWEAVQTLHPKYRVPLVLHHYEGMSYKDIAATMELGLSAVEARIHRAKKQLIKRLEPLLSQL